MANLYKKNFELLKGNVPMIDVIEHYLEKYQEYAEHIKTIDGVPHFQKDGEWYAMQSVDCSREAERLMKSIDPYKDYLIILGGMGNPQLLYDLVNKTSNGTKIVMVEQNPYIMKYAFSHVNFMNMMEGNKFVICHGDDDLIDTMAIICVNAGWENLSQNMRVVSMPYMHFEEGVVVKTIKALKKIILNNLSGLGNSVEDMIHGLVNEYKNVDECIKANGIAELRGKYKGYPGIVVSAGPSLDKNIQLLKGLYEKAVIITTDAANRACEAIDAKVDGIASIERDIPTYNYFYKEQELDPDMVFVGPALVWPDILSEYKGKKVLLAKTPQGIDGWWGDFFPQQEFILQGFSCSNVAHAVLEQMGCDPIILIGQDFAYTGNKRHSENSKYFKNNDTKELTKENHKQWVMGVDGEDVPTNEVFNQFREIMEQMITLGSATVIDATEGGALIKGTEIMTFKEAIEKYCTKDIPYHMKDLLEEKHVETGDYLECYKRIIEGIDGILQDAHDILGRIKEYCKVLNKFVDVDFEQMSEDELIQVILELQGTNSVIDFLIKEKANLITFFQGNLKQTVIYVKKIGNEVTPQNVKRNWELQLHLMYLMELTTNVILKEYGIAKEYIMNKMEERK